jgi:putative tryptophan/tyrosine transport system substrate-binding protein
VRSAATYVAKIVKGARPADLLVRQPMTVELLINLEMAKARAFKAPPTSLAMADEVIE